MRKRTIKRQIKLLEQRFNRALKKKTRLWRIRKEMEVI